MHIAEVQSVRLTLNNDPQIIIKTWYRNREHGNLCLNVTEFYIKKQFSVCRAPIWQSSWREAALPGASLAQTCLAFRLPPQEGAV